MTRRDRFRAAPDPDGLRALADELHGRNLTAPLTAGPEAAILEYVRRNPGSAVRAVVPEIRGRLSYRAAEHLIRELFRSGQLVTDAAAEGVTFHGHTRLYVAPTSGNT